MSPHFQLTPAKAPDGTPLLMMSAQPMGVLVEGLLRNLKASFPELYRQVYYEIQVTDANGKPKFTVPDRIEGQK